MSAADALIASAAEAARALPRVTVSVDNLIAKQHVGKRSGHTANLIQHFARGVRSVALPCSRAGTEEVQMLAGVTATFAAGSSTLVLGAPGSGKSTLLRAVSGRLHSKDPAVSAAVRFSGATLDELKSQRGIEIQRLAAYAPQRDEHQTFLTVKEVLTFAHESCAAPAPEGASEAVAKDRAERVARVIEAFGLKECENTIMGNAIVRGISGGQKRRVTVAETFLSCARVYAGDEITNGLDSAVAVDVVRFFVRWARESGGTFVTALQAPTPEVTAAFDAVLVLAEGRVLYHGPPSGMSRYFAAAGFPAPSYVDDADFAVQLATSPATALSLYAEDIAAVGGPAPVGNSVGALADHWERVRAAAVAIPASPSIKVATVVTVAPAAPPSPRAAAAAEAGATAAAASPVAAAGAEIELAPTATAVAVAVDAATTPAPALSIETTTAAPEPAYPTKGGPALDVAAIVAGTVAAPVAAPFAAADHPAVAAQFGRKHVHSAAKHGGLLFKREGTLYYRNKGLVMAKIMQSIVLALIFGGVFFQIAPLDFFLRVSVFFFCLVSIAFSSIAEVPTTTENKLVVTRQVDGAYYPPVAYVLSLLGVQLPVILVADLAFAAILYFMVGLYASAGRFFFFYFVIVSMDLTFNGLFKLYGLAARSQELAGVLAGAGTGLMLVYAGFLIPRQQLVENGAPIPFYFFTPFSWALRSLSLNEFTSPAWTGPAIGIVPPVSNGEFACNTFGFYWNNSTAWMISGPFVLLGYYIIFGVIGCSLVLYLKKPTYALGTRRTPDHGAIAATLLPPPEPTSPVPGHPAAAVAATATPTAATLTASSTALAIVPAAGGAPVAPGALAITVPRPVASKGVAGLLALPCVHATLAFRDITYTVVNARTKKELTLLRGITSVCRPGTMTALMGASGAGKTTLLDVLADRKNSGKIGGIKRVNGYDMTPLSFARISAYAEQFDEHIDTTTVMEALRFSARLRLEADVPHAQRETFVAGVADALELTDIGDRSVASLAPGELKRLSLGVELASNPSILFADEPTTGLDSRAAASVVRCLQTIAASGRAIVCTVHQPSSAVFLAFSHLLLLAPGGYQVFDGPIGHRGINVQRYLEAVPGVEPLPVSINPASWMIEQTARLGAMNKAAAAAAAAAGAAAPAPADGAAQAAQQQPDALPQLAQYFNSSPLKIEAAVDAAVALEPGAGKSAPRVAFLTLLAAPLLTQMAAVMSRSIKDAWRSPTVGPIRLWVYLFIGIFFAITFEGAGAANSQGTTLAKLGLLFSSGIFPGIAFLNTTMPALFRIRPAYYRERAAHFFIPEAFSLSVLVRDIPFIAGYMSIYLVLYYFATGLASSAGAFFTQLLALFLLLLYYHAIGTWLAAMLPNEQVAGILSGLCITMTNLFAGLQIPPSQLPPGWKWLYSIDGVAQYLRLSAMSQFDCADAPCPTFLAVDAGPAFSTNPYSYISGRLESDAAARWNGAGYLVLITAILGLVAIFMFRKVNHQVR